MTRAAPGHPRHAPQPDPGGSNAAMPSQLFRTKPLALLLAEANGEHRLRRVLGPVQLTGLGVGAIIGAGIFVATGVAAHDIAGPALMLSFVVAGITCMFAALCYAEFASMAPVAGSRLHLRLRHAGRAVRLDHRLGPGARVRGRRRDGGARLVGLLPERAGAASAWQLPRATCAAPPSHYDPATGELRAPRAPCSTCRRSLIVAALTAVLVKGIQESANFNAVMVVVKLAAVLFVILRRRVLRRPGQLGAASRRTAGRGSASSAHQLVGQTTPRARRSACSPGAGDHLLRLHRLRLGLDPGRGGAATRSATCRSASSRRCCVCTVLYIARGRGADRHGALRPDRHRRRRVSRASRSAGCAWARAADRGGRRGRHHVGAARDDARRGRASSWRWPATAWCRATSSPPSTRASARRGRRRC